MQPTGDSGSQGLYMVSAGIWRADGEGRVLLSGGNALTCSSLEDIFGTRHQRCTLYRLARNGLLLVPYNVMYASPCHFTAPLLQHKMFEIVECGMLTITTKPAYVLTRKLLSKRSLRKLAAIIG